MYPKYIVLTFYTCFIMLLTTCMTPLMKVYRYMCDAGIEVETDRAKVMQNLGLELTDTQKDLINKEAG